MLFQESERYVECPIRLVKVGQRAVVGFEADQRADPTGSVGCQVLFERPNCAQRLLEDSRVPAFHSAIPHNSYSFRDFLRVWWAQRTLSGATGTHTSNSVLLCTAFITFFHILVSKSLFQIMHFDIKEEKKQKNSEKPYRSTDRHRVEPDLCVYKLSSEQTHKSNGCVTLAEGEAGSQRQRERRGCFPAVIFGINSIILPLAQEPCYCVATAVINALSHKSQTLVCSR